MKRDKGNHLNAREVERMRQAFRDQKSTAEAAEELNCSERTASKYYAQFRGAPHQTRGRPKKQQRVHVPATPRFYKSNFEL